MEFLSSMFFSLMFTRLMATARREGIEGRLPVRVNMVLDEFCNIYIAKAALRRKGRILGRQAGDL